MRRTRIYIVITLMISITCLIGCTRDSYISSPLTTEQKIEDFNYLYKTIEENYPFLEVNKRVNNIDWLEQKEYYLELVKNTPDDKQFLIALNNILSDLNNGHTHMILDSNQFRTFREIYTMNNGWQKKVQLNILNNKKALARYNIDKNEKINALEQSITNEKIEVENASVQDIVEGNIGYIYIPKMISYYNMGKDIELIDSYLNKIKNYKALVIDIRGNGGGDSYYWISYLLPKLVEKTYTSTQYIFWKDGDVIEKFLKETGLKFDKDFGEIEDLDISIFNNLPNEVTNDFKYYLKDERKINPNEDSIKFNGNIYLLVDRYVYSSAEALASFAKESGLATLIGERTCGDGIGSDPLLDMLPNSGYVFRFARDMGVTSDGSCNEEFKTEPDYEIEFPKKMNSIEYDYCIKKVLELESINN